MQDLIDQIRRVVGEYKPSAVVADGQAVRASILMMDARQTPPIVINDAQTARAADAALNDDERRKQLIADEAEAWEGNGKDLNAWRGGDAEPVDYNAWRKGR